MSINTTHSASNKGVVIFNGERIMIFYKNVDLKLEPTKPNIYMHGKNEGRVYLTTHRVIFISKNASSKLQSFAMPLINMKAVNIRQPLLGSNLVEGIIYAEIDGGWTDNAKFSLSFKSGGAIEFGRSLIEAGKRARHHNTSFRPPAFRPVPCAQYYDAPPPAYSSIFQDVNYGFVVPHSSFVAPSSGDIFVNMAPPPYPGATETALYYAVPPVQDIYYNQAYNAGGAAYPTVPPPSYSEVDPTPLNSGSADRNAPYISQAVSSAPPPYGSPNEKKVPLE